MAPRSAARDPRLGTGVFFVGIGIDNRGERFKRSGESAGRSKEAWSFVNAKTIFIVFLLMTMSLTALAVSPVAHGGTLINSQLVEETGPTTALGGGDHVFVRFGTDAAFGVVYGTTANPNNIYLVAIKARYLGVAQVVDPSGGIVASNRPIKIYTLYAVKLDSLIEFRDGNGNGIADYARVYNATTGRFTNYFGRLGDTLYKRVDLNTNWTRSPIVEGSGATYRNWTFNLTAQDQPYAAVANYSGSVAGALPLVRFTFHLNASLEQIDNATVPQWRVTVGTAGGTVVTNLSRMANLTVSGKVVHYDLKWDQDIEGWTYAAANAPAGARRRILLELGAVVGNLIPRTLVDAWFQSRVMDQMRESGTAQFTSPTGPRAANNTTGTYAVPQVLQRPSIDFSGNSTRIARLVWVGDSVVDGVTQPVYGQVVAGARVAAVGEQGNAFVGFVLLAGLSFRGGASIVHDPTVSTDIQADLQLPGGRTFPGLLGAAIAAVAVIALVLVIVIVVSRRRKRADPPPPPPPP
jgi:hypothetical protein